MGKKMYLYICFSFLCCLPIAPVYGYGVTANYSAFGGSCSPGYVLDTNIFGAETCVSPNTYCYHHYGVNTAYDMQTDQCVCSYGSEWGENTVTGKPECQLCTLVHGSHSTYNTSNRQCICAPGYMFDRNGQCAQQHTISVLLTQLDTTMNQAVIYNNYQSYHITYGTGCASTTFPKYLLKNMMVMLGNNFNMDIQNRIIMDPGNNTSITPRDTIVLSADDQSCDITSVERVDDNFVIRSPQK